MPIYKPGKPILKNNHPFRWTDGLATLLAIVGVVASDPTAAGICLMSAAIVGCFGVINHHNWSVSIKIVICALVFQAAAALFLYIHHMAVQRALEQSRGIMLAGNGKSPVNNCQTTPSSNIAVVHLGSMFVSVAKSIYPVLSAGDRGVLTIERKTYDFLLGSLNALSIKQLQLFDDLGREVVFINDDKYVVRESARFERTKMNNITVFDYRGVEILNIEYTNPKMIQIRGVFRSGNSILTITDRETINSAGAKLVGGTGCFNIANGIKF